MLCRVSLSFALVSLSLFAQPEPRWSFGAKIGSVLTNPSENLPWSNSQQGRWTGGPTIEFRLPYRLSIELDLLYRGDRTTSTFTYNPGGGTSTAQFQSVTKSRALDVPLLLKYHLLDRRRTAAPFISAGFQWTNEFRSVSSLGTCFGPLGSCDVPGIPATPSFNRLDYTRYRDGVVAGAGVDIKTRHVTITPEIRYRHLDHSKLNQVAAMVGFTFKK